MTALHTRAGEALRAAQVEHLRQTALGFVCVECLSPVEPELRRAGITCCQNCCNEAAAWDAEQRVRVTR